MTHDPNRQLSTRSTDKESPGWGLPLGIAQSWEEKHGRTLARPGTAEGEP